MSGYLFKIQISKKLKKKNINNRKKPLNEKNIKKKNIIIKYNKKILKTIY